MRILIIEDEKHLNSLVARKLKNEKYSVDSCYDGDDAASFLDCAEYDVVLLDLMLPGKSGLEILRDLRGSGDKTPVIILTAKDSIDDRVRGLDLGADDYLVKPFSLDELLARIRVMTRRSGGQAENSFEAAGFRIEFGSRKVFRDGECIELTAKEFDILEYLVRNRDTVVSRERLVSHAWDYDYDGVSNVIDVYIRYLRRKIDSGFEPKLIKTVRGKGYMFSEKE